MILFPTFVIYIPKKLLLTRFILFTNFIKSLPFRTSGNVHFLRLFETFSYDFVLGCLVVGRRLDVSLGLMGFVESFVIIIMWSLWNYHYKICFRKGFPMLKYSKSQSTSTWQDRVGQMGVLDHEDCAFERLQIYPDEGFCSFCYA